MNILRAAPNTSFRCPANSSISEDPQQAISERIASNPALKEWQRAVEGRSSIEGTVFAASVGTYGFSFLDGAALRKISTIVRPHGGKVLSVFTGLGYAEAQMVAAGMDVIGFDEKVAAHRWLLDTHKGPSGLPLSRYKERALFMSFPDLTREGRSVAADVVSRYLKAGGSTVMVVAEGRPLEHAIKCDRALLERLAEGQLIAQVALPKWPSVTTFMGYGHVHSTFEPVLTAYRFG